MKKTPYYTSTLDYSSFLTKNLKSHKSVDNSAFQWIFQSQIITFNTHIICWRWKSQQWKKIQFHRNGSRYNKHIKLDLSWNCLFFPLFQMRFKNVWSTNSAWFIQKKQWTVIPTIFFRCFFLKVKWKCENLPKYENRRIYLCGNCD